MFNPSSISRRTGTGMYNVYTEAQNKIAVALPSYYSIRLGVGPARGSLEGTGENREVESGRPPTGGPVVPTGKNTVLPESLGPTDLVPLREERNDSATRRLQVPSESVAAVGLPGGRARG
jgi:hypothetical protein